MFSLCLFVLVPMYSFSSNGYFLSLMFISLLCLKTAILILFILPFSNLMKQVLLFIFHEEKKSFLDHPFLYLFLFKFTDQFIHSIYWWQSIFFLCFFSRMGRKFLCALPYFLPLLSSGASLPLLCLQKLVTTVEI